MTRWQWAMECMKPVAVCAVIAVGYHYTNDFVCAPSFLIVLWILTKN